MKKSLLLFLVLGAFLSACDKSPTEPVLTNVILSADKVGIFADGNDAITFIANFVFLPDTQHIKTESKPITKKQYPVSILFQQQHLVYRASYF